VKVRAMRAPVRILVIMTLVIDTVFDADSHATRPPMHPVRQGRAPSRGTGAPVRDATSSGLYRWLISSWRVLLCAE
jgi:hypothetical protein